MRITTVKTQQLDEFDLLMHCAIKLNLARIDAEKIGAKVNRNQVVRQYFMQKALRPPKGAVNMVKNVIKDIRTAAYTFDQYFQLYIGFKPTLDCNPLGEIVKAGLKEKFNVEVEEIPYALTPTI